MGALENTPVAVDVCGSDSGVAEVVSGAVRACAETSLHCVLVGDQDHINSILDELGQSGNAQLSVVHAPDEVTMDDSPSAVLRAKQQSSMRVAFRLVAENQACALVSAGNTGAVMAAGLSVFGTFEGIERPAIATSLPTRKEDRLTVLLDSGANVQCNAAQLTQFAIMGSSFVRIRTGTEQPRVGILSNGSELSKGTAITRQAAELLQAVPGMEFLGFIEGGDLSSGEVDVAVCDGFVGNVVLKSIEGTAQMVSRECAQCAKSLASDVGDRLREHVRRRFDAATYGGAPLLGLLGIAMVCHGSSSREAIANAIRLSWRLHTSQFVSLLDSELKSYDWNVNLGAQAGGL